MIRSYLSTPILSREVNNRINNIHYRALHIVYNDNTSSFEDLLRKDGSVTIHQKNLRFLALEMFKVIHGATPSFMSDNFTKKSNLNSENISSNTRSNSTFHNYFHPKISNYGLDTLRHLGPKVYDIVPNDFRNSPSIEIFKSKIKTWIPTKWPCGLCREYIANVGFINSFLFIISYLLRYN